MSALFKQYKTDATKENKGVSIPFLEAENEDGTIPTFKISRMGKANKRYSKALDLASRPHRRSMELGTMIEAVAKTMMLNVFCETVLLGWENVLDEDGNVIEFSVENAKALMLALDEVYIRLTAEANLLDNFKANAVEAEAKN